MLLIFVEVVDGKEFKIFSWVLLMLGFVIVFFIVDIRGFFSILKNSLKFSFIDKNFFICDFI